MASQEALSGSAFLVSERENTALATPPPKIPRFVFLSEEKEVPEKLYNLQEISLRRREEFQTNIHELELRAAGLSARLAQESMDRQNALQDVVTNDLYKPLEASINDLQLGTKNDRPSATSSWIRLEGRLSALDTKMTHSLHADLEDALREKLEDLLAKLEYQIQPDTKLELYKANKREGRLFHRFEELVGSMARRFHEERISLQAAIARTSNQIAAMEDLDQQKGELFLEKIGKIQALLDEERNIRRAQDARIMQRIEQQESIMKEALMEVIGIEQAEEANFRKFDPEIMFPIAECAAQGQRPDGAVDHNVFFDGFDNDDLPAKAPAHTAHEIGVENHTLDSPQKCPTIIALSCASLSGTSGRPDQW